MILHDTKYLIRNRLRCGCIFRIIHAHSTQCGANVSASTPVKPRHIRFSWRSRRRVIANKFSRFANFNCPPTSRLAGILNFSCHLCSRPHFHPKWFRLRFICGVEFRILNKCGERRRRKWNLAWNLETFEMHSPLRRCTLFRFRVLFKFFHVRTP